MSGSPATPPRRGRPDRGKSARACDRPGLRGQSRVTLVDQRTDARLERVTIGPPLAGGLELLLCHLQLGGRRCDRRLGMPDLQVLAVGDRPLALLIAGKPRRIGFLWI